MAVWPPGGSGACLNTGKLSVGFRMWEASSQQCVPLNTTCQTESSLHSLSQVLCSNFTPGKKTNKSCCHASVRFGLRKHKHYLTPFRHIKYIDKRYHKTQKLSCVKSIKTTQHYLEELTKPSDRFYIKNLFRGHFHTFKHEN